MHRTQLLLEPWQYEALKAMAERRGESISSLLRKAVTDFLHAKPPKRKARLEDIEGIISDPGFSGKDHDLVLYGWKKKRR